MQITQAVLLMAHGAARDVDDLERYYTHIRGGRPPRPEQLAELAHRYRAIGGRSPFFSITERTARRLEAALSARQGMPFRVYLGLKHSPPFIEDAVRALIADNIQRVYGLVLAPHFSSLSVGQYLAAAEAALVRNPSPPAWVPIRSWHLQPQLIHMLAERTRAGIQQFSPRERLRLTIVFTAHSLPARVLASGDPYPRQVRETVEAVMEQVPGAFRYEFAWQSRGRTDEAWLEPDILERLPALHAQGARAVLAVPVGFVSDHLEILYDLDRQAKERAQALNLGWGRTQMPNADPEFVETLVQCVLAAGGAGDAAEVR